ncbi:hypothetical protein ABEF92_004907 [Exophiala dermatitidis]
MYIPRTQISIDHQPSPFLLPSASTPSRFGEDLLSLCNTDAIISQHHNLARAGVSEEGSTNSTSESTAVIASATFISVAVSCLGIFALIFGFAIYKKCLSPTRRNGASDDGSSDSSSTSTTSGDGAWQIDSTYITTGEILTDRELIAKRHRKRLKILDKVAPIQSLHDWRADKTTKHEQTFATLATKLICAICLDLIDEKEQIRELHCGHVYHAPCLNLWVERGHHDCPLCKFDILGLNRRAVKELGTQTQTQTQTQQIQEGGGGGGRGENTATATGNAATAATPAAAGGLVVDSDGDAVVSTEQSQSHSERGER